MNAGNYPFKPTWSSLWHIAHQLPELLFRRPKPGEIAISIERLVLILDVSKWQGLIDFLKMLVAGAMGVIVKCGQGSAQDPQWAINWIKAKVAGVPRGSYWYFDSRVEPKAQAKNWWSWISGDGGELMHFADYEESYGGTWKGWQNFKIFLQEFQRLSSLPSSKIGIYTGYYYWIANSPTNLTDLNWFGQFPLWLAWYTTDPTKVIIPKPWTELILWQFGTPVEGEKYGAESLEIDESFFSGNEQAYRERFGLAGGGPQQGGTMQGTVRSNVTRGLNVRNAAGEVVASLLFNFDLGKGDVVYGEVKADGRIYFQKIYRAKGTVETLPSVCSAITQEGTSVYMDLANVAEPGSTPQPGTVTLKNWQITVNLDGVDHTFNG